MNEKERHFSEQDEEEVSLSERHAQEGDHVQPPVTQCFRCARRYPGPFCEAFPHGIPDELQLGDVDHANPYPGDRGLTFVEGKSPHLTYQE